MYKRRISIFCLFACAVALTACNRKEVCECKTADGTVEKWTADDCVDEWEARQCVAPHHGSIQRPDAVIKFASLARGMTINVTPNSPTAIPTAAEVEVRRPVACDVACNDPQSPWCQIVLPGNTTDVNAGADRLATRLVAADTIPKVDIMSDFGVTNDPCERSDTSVNGTALSNTGLACKFITEIEIGAASQIAAMIEIPKTLRAAITRASGPEITLTFSDRRAEAPHLVLSEFWDADYGGAITEMHYRDRSLTISTERGCLRLP